MKLRWMRGYVFSRYTASWFILAQFTCSIAYSAKRITCDFGLAGGQVKHTRPQTDLRRHQSAPLCHIPRALQFHYPKEKNKKNYNARKEW